MILSDENTAIVNVQNLSASQLVDKASIKSKEAGSSDSKRLSFAMASFEFDHPDAFQRRHFSTSVMTTYEGFVCKVLHFGH
jgi:hypothetical protein